MHSTGPEPGKYYKDEHSGEIIFVVAKVHNHFHNSEVVVFESSFAPGEYLHLHEKHRSWNSFMLSSKKEMVRWHDNYKTNTYLNPLSKKEEDKDG